MTAWRERGRASRGSKIEAVDVRLVEDERLAEDDAVAIDLQFTEPSAVVFGRAGLELAGHEVGCGLVINSEENGVALTYQQHRKTKLHEHDNIKIINDRIVDADKGITNWAEGRKDVLEELQKIKNEILNGQFP